MKDHSSFFNDVHEVVKLIPKGRVTSYGAIGNYRGLTSSARMIGWAMNASHIMKNIPAHRVVNRNGLLTGKHHFETPSRMQELLEAEGVVIKENKIVAFSDHFWDPAVELF